jgi:hypothetical protein
MDGRDLTKKVQGQAQIAEQTPLETLQLHMFKYYEVGITTQLADALHLISLIITTRQKALCQIMELC